MNPEIDKLIELACRVGVLWNLARQMKNTNQASMVDTELHNALNELTEHVCKPVPPQPRSP